MGTLLSVLLIGVSLVVWGTKPTAVEANPALPTPSPPASSATSPQQEPTEGQDTPAPAAPTSDQVDDPSSGASEPPVQFLELDDTSLTVPAGWEIYADELVEGERRMVRLSHTDTDARYQAVSLTAADPVLGTSCRALVSSQMDNYEVTGEDLVVAVGVDEEEGEGVSCGFTGIRQSDGVANHITYTLVRRDTDSHVLMLRQTVPESLPAGSEARRDLSAMNCDTTTGFGVALPLC